jgi:phage shock protein PspC (stress-responsive transcriptional regulator)
MNRVITINLGGTAYQLEEQGYDALRAYLDTASQRLAGNPDREEILSDIEQAIADKFRAQLSAHKNVVTAREVEAALAAMGPIEDDAAEAGAKESGAGATGAGPSTANAGASSSGPMPKRLYCIHEGAMLAGVCNGLAAYFNIDPTLVRLAFVFLTMLWGFGVLVYLIMAVVVPSARSPEQKAAAYGAPFTTQEFIRRAKEGYYEAMRNFPNKGARREWKRRFKEDMRNWRASFETEMRTNTEQWRQDWHRGWAASVHPGLAVAVPLFSLLQAACVIAWLCALVSVLGTGTLFGLGLPAGVPVWAALLILLFAYGFMMWPLKMMRRACYYDLSGRRYRGPFVFFVDAVVWFAVAIFVAWLALHHLSQVREAIQNIPPTVQTGMDAIRDWWQHK